MAWPQWRGARAPRSQLSLAWSSERSCQLGTAAMAKRCVGCVGTVLHPGTAESGSTLERRLTTDCGAPPCGRSVGRLLALARLQASWRAAFEKFGDGGSGGEARC